MQEISIEENKLENIKLKKCTIDSYKNSKQELINYIYINDKNPSEKIWNEIAINKNLLSSKTLGYIEGAGFNKLCKNIRKNLKKILKFKNSIDN